MKTETWKPIAGYENYYEVSNTGFIRSIKRSKLLQQAANHRGYFRVALSKDGVSKQVTVHRVVAEIFIPNPENKPTINHKNGIKTDNRVENLEWATYSENMIHSCNVIKRGTFSVGHVAYKRFSSGKSPAKKSRSIQKKELLNLLSAVADHRQSFGGAAEIISSAIVEYVNKMRSKLNK